MAPSSIEWIAVVASCMTTPSYVLQAIKILRTRDTKAISTGMYVLLTVGMGLWLTYGIFISSPGLIIGNFIGVSFSAAILALKIKHG